MAQLAVAGGGAAIGAVAGSIIPGVGTLLGAQVGWAIGSVAGALLFPPKGADQNGPRLNDLSVQTSGYGVPIALVAGQAKLAGNMIWSIPPRRPVTRRRQGKGGGGPRVTSYSYFGSWAVGLCEWLMPPGSPGVLRIWLDNKLVFDGTGSSDTVRIPGLTWRFYPGSETQFPDPAIEAAAGSLNAPAHRGLAYIVFDDVPLERFGNRIPNVVVELADSVVETAPDVTAVAPASPLWPSDPSNRLYLDAWPTNVVVDHARGRIYEGRTRSSGTVGTTADEMIRVYDLVTMQTLSEHRLDTIVQPLWGLFGTPVIQNTGVGLMHLGADGFLYVCGGTDSYRLPLYKVDPDAMVAVAVFGALGGPSYSFTDDGALLTLPMQITSVQVPRLQADPLTILAVQGSYSGTLLINAGRMEYIWGAETALDPPPIEPGLGIGPLTYPIKLVPGREDLIDGSEIWYLRGTATTSPYKIDVVRIRVTSGALNLGGGAAMGVRRENFPSIDLASEVDASVSFSLIQDAWWDGTDETLVITVACATGPSRFATFKWQPGGSVVWAVVNHAGAIDNDARGQAARALSGTWGWGGNFLVQTGGGSPLVNASGAAWRNSLSYSDEQQAVIGWATVGRQLTKRYLLRVAASSLTVGVVVDALCKRAGLTTPDVNVSALTDGLRGYLLARPMSARDAITPLAAYSQFDAVEQDDVLVFRLRGGAVAAAIPFDALVREDPDAVVIEEQRAQDADMPRTVTVRFADIERGWEQNAQSWTRPLRPTATMQARGDAAMDLPIPMTAAEAREVARRFCVAAWRERTRLSFSLPPSYLRLVPTDVLTVTTRDGATIRCRLLTVQLGGNWVTRVEAVTEDAAVYGLTSAADGGTGWQPPTMPMPYRVRLIVPNLALIQDGDDLGQAELREYAFACAYDGAQFRGVTVVERGGGAAWENLGVVTTPVEWGALVETPPAPATPWTWDEVGTLRVRMTSGEPESATSLEVLAGANRAALVAVDGSAEIVQWRTAAQQADGTWILSGLLRGRRGTEDRIASRGAGNAFIILDGTRLLYAAGITEATATRQLKAVSIFDTPDTAPGPVVKSLRGRAEMPYAPAQITASRDGPLNLSIDWVRRTRVGGEWLDGTGTVALGEGAEAYKVDILNGPPPPGATYAASSESAAPVLDAFDGNVATGWGASGGAHNIDITFGADQVVRQYQVVAPPTFLTDAPESWKFQGRQPQVITYSATEGAAANLWDELNSSTWIITTSGLPQSNSITFEAARTLAQYGVRAADFSATNAPSAWTLAGSDDGSSWTTIDSRTGVTSWTDNEIKLYSLGAPVSYRWFRLTISAGNGGASTTLRACELRATVGGDDFAAGFTTLDSRAGQSSWTSNEQRTYALASAATYRIFRLRIATNNGGGNTRIAELRINRLTGASAGNIAAANYTPAILRTIDTVVPAATYTAAQQTTDFGAIQPEVLARIQQVSSIVGRGVPAEVIL